MSAESLERALRAEGIACVVEAQERLAVIVPGPRGLDLSSAELRRRALALLPAHGFTHLALELLPAPDQPSAASATATTTTGAARGATVPRP